MFFFLGVVLGAVLRRGFAAAGNEILTAAPPTLPTI
jgi:hypothetical protein